MTQLTAAFMAIGLSGSADFGRAREHIDIGHIDMVDSLVQYAQFVDDLGHAGLGAVGNYPGVFTYEVSEAIGERYCSALLGCEPGHCPDQDQMLTMMRLVAYDFFMQAFGDIAGTPAGEMRGAELARALAAVEFKS